MATKTRNVELKKCAVPSNGFCFSASPQTCNLDAKKFPHLTKIRFVAMCAAKKSRNLRKQKRWRLQSSPELKKLVVRFDDENVNRCDVCD